MTLHVITLLSVFAIGHVKTVGRFLACMKLVKFYDAAFHLYKLKT